MVINLIVSIFLFVFTKANQKNEFYLSPTSPPSAFLAQYYTVQFRVIGLNNPSFSFKGLPSFLVGSNNGILQGVPDTVGSFLVTVAYSSGNVTGEDNVVLRVTSYLNQPQVNQTTSNFQVLYPNSSLTFFAGSTAKLTFQVQNGKNPYIWSITNLPPGIYADTKGNINGTFIQEGYYTVSVSVSDMSGKSTYNYFVFNVQPKNANPNKLVQVPNRNTNQKHFNLSQIQSQQIAATKAIFQNAQKVFKAQNETNSCREKVANTTLAMQLAQQQVDRFENRTKDIESIKTLASAIAIRAQGILNSTNNRLSLSTTNYTNYQKQLQTQNKKLNQSQVNFEQAALRLNQSSRAFIAAQNQSLMAALNLKIVQSANQDALDTYQKAFDAYSHAKKILQDQQNTLISANFIVDAARTSLSLANQANDQILSNLKMVQNIYEKTNSILDSTQKLVQSFRSALKEATNDLQVSKFDLLQAMNTLFVAQAAKAEADKATALVSMQTTQNKNVSSIQSSIFAGCDQGAYPMISGTASILQKNSFSFKLSSGNILAYGSCSNVEPELSIGELVNFGGYLKEGFVHTLQLRRANF